ncbi:MAG: hypothetical protein SFX73_39835 [Kofleriaceae bacterium]|nr:hypothetical protein [Kofleriaceae bacterium]
MTSIALFAGACGTDDTMATPDGAGPVDATPEPDAPVGPVTGPVKVITRTPGLDVIFLAADGALVAKTTTNAAREAEATMEAGGSVTVVDPENTRIDTITEVEPGDVLSFAGAYPTQPPGGELAYVTVSWPARFDVTRYAISTNCSGAPNLSASTTSFEIAFCPPSTYIRVESSAADGPDRFMLDGNVTGGTHTMSLANWAVAPINTTTHVRITGVPETPALVAETRLLSELGTIYGNSRLLFSNQITPTLVSQEPLPLVEGGQVWVGLSAQLSGSESFEKAARMPSMAAPSIELGFMENVPSLPLSAATDPSTRTVSWVEASGGVIPTNVRVGIRTSTNQRWRIVAPRRATTTVTFPRLPAPYDTVELDAEGSPSISLSHHSLGFSAAMRRRAFDVNYVLDPWAVEIGTSTRSFTSI